MTRFRLGKLRPCGEECGGKLELFMEILHNAIRLPRHSIWLIGVILQFQFPYCQNSASQLCHGQIL
jgi:hypothetical protein